MERERTFINFTNHPSARWDAGQRQAAEALGTVIDMPFPQVSPGMTEGEIDAIAKKYVAEILTKEPAAVLCQGEFTLCFRVVSALKDRGIPVMAACSERIVEETEKGKLVKFRFEGFRKY